MFNRIAQYAVFRHHHQRHRGDKRQRDNPRHAQAEALLDRFHAESNEDGHAHALTGSVGIVSTDDPSLSIDELIRRGDEALYHAKRAGKSQCYVYQEDEPLS